MEVVDRRYLRLKSSGTPRCFIVCLWGPSQIIQACVKENVEGHMKCGTRAFSAVLTAHFQNGDCNDGSCVIAVSPVLS